MIRAPPSFSVSLSSSPSLSLSLLSLDEPHAGAKRNATRPLDESSHQKQLANNCGGNERSGKGGRVSFHPRHSHDSSRASAAHLVSSASPFCALLSSFVRRRVPVSQALPCLSSAFFSLLSRATPVMADRTRKKKRKRERRGKKE